MAKVMSSLMGIVLLSCLLLIALGAQLPMDDAMKALDGQAAARGWADEMTLFALSRSEPIEEGMLGPRAGETVRIPGYGPVQLSQRAESLYGSSALIVRLALLTGGGQRWDCQGIDDVWIIRELSPDDVAMMHIVGGVEDASFVTRGYSAVVDTLKNIKCRRGGPGALAN